MKKICICTTISLTMKSFVLETAKYLHSQCGYDVTLVCNEDLEFAQSLPEYLHYAPVHMARGIDFSALQSVSEFIKLFKEQKFDMVQYATPNAACYASIASKFCKVPVRLYSQWGIRYVGLKGLSRRIFKMIEKMVCRNSTHIHAVSRLNKQFAIGEGLYSSDKAEVVGNGGTIGVDMLEYSIEKKEIFRKEIREEYGVAEDEFLFGFVGRISADKGCTELLEAFKAVTQSYDNAKLLLVGPQEEKLGISEELKTWAERAPQVVMTGKVEHEKMKKYYAAMDVLVHPTYREGFGMVIQEAGALAVPVITTNIPGASEVMEDGVSCLLVEPRNAQELQMKMQSFLEDDLLGKKYGQEAYKRTKVLYDRTVMLENQRIAYEKLLR